MPELRVGSSGRASGAGARGWVRRSGGRAEGRGRLPAVVAPPSPLPPLPPPPQLPELGRGEAVARDGVEWRVAMGRGSERERE